MSRELNFRDDPRTTDELVNFVLSQTDEDLVWNAVACLHWRGTVEVLRRAELLSKSSCRSERRLGADILGQLGVPDRSFPSECTRILSGMLCVDEDPEVLSSVLIALSHQDCTSAIPLVATFSDHTDARVRCAAVLAFATVESPPTTLCLIRLGSDPDDNVRDWATFALGTLSERDTSEIREALFRRIADPHDDTRGEALVGLARRKDFRVIDALKTELASDCVGSLAIEAAEMIASPELCPQLVNLKMWWDVDPCLLDRAIAACG